MTNDEKMISFSEKVDNFLVDALKNSGFSYNEIVTIILARVVVSAQQIGHEETILNLLPVMKESIMRNKKDDLFQQ